MSDSTNPPAPQFGLHTLRQLKEITLPFFSSESKGKARALLTVLLVLSFAVAGVQVLMSYVGRDFMTALTENRSAEFWKNLWLYLGVFALAVPI
jgi:vitamin B12/bleomycin/antimicrobial peptide transport system ATP-binding/permease protein